MARLTLQQIADHFQKTPKTFMKYVRLQKIPHILIGRSPMFALSEVEAHLAARTPDPAKVVQFKPVKRSKVVKSKFAEAVGV